MNRSSKLLQKNYPRWAVVSVVIMMIVAVLGVSRFAAATAAQPTKADFVHLQNQREVIDVASEAYGPLITDFTTDYITAYNEERTDEVKQSIRETFVERFEQENEIGNQRLSDMRKSVALKDDGVRTDFEQFDSSYLAALAYLEQYVATLVNINEANGVCGMATKLDVSADEYEKNFVSASEKCLAALEQQKQGSTKAGVDLLTALEKTFSDRQALFKQAAQDSEADESLAVKISALASLLSLNKEINDAQNAFKQATSTEYDVVVKKSNQANEKLLKTLTERISADATKESGS